MRQATKAEEIDAIISYTVEGIKHGLHNQALNRYVHYMVTRWIDPNRAREIIETGYAEEWARRFLHGMEYDYSDRYGKAILQEIDGSMSQGKGGEQ